ncbi:MAG: hypothetical protein IPO83_13545 [Chitinophagaceae bacterium]|nr:hypothetical protein [Chitinophagaceae bacterium]
MSEKTVGIGSRVQHPKFGLGVVTGVRLTTYLITFMEAGQHEVNQFDEQLEIIDAVEISSEIETLSEVEKSLLGILKKWADIQEVVPLGERWIGGSMILKPVDAKLQSKEIPIEAFFHKIVMLRDRLRVLEQNINSHSKLTDEEKVNLQQYITRIYGTLTTFNVLFRNKEHQFIGEKGKQD